MEILLIRHAEQLYPYNEQGKKMVSGVDAPLVELGRQQMRELREELKRQGRILNAVYRSPLLRARQSADELVGNSDVPIYEVDNLKEGYPNSAEGHAYDELEERGGDIYAHSFGEQESLDHLVERSRQAVKEILENANNHGFESIAIVGHGDPLCALQWGLHNEGLPTSYAEMKKDFYPQKGKAYLYPVSQQEPFRVTGEGRIFTTKAANETIEGLRSANKEGV